MAEILSQEEIDSLLAGISTQEQKKFGIFDTVDDPRLIRKLLTGTNFDTPFYLGNSDEELISRYNNERQNQIKNLLNSDSKAKFLANDGYIMARVDGDQIDSIFNEYISAFCIPEELAKKFEEEVEEVVPAVNEPEQTAPQEQVEVVQEPIPESREQIPQPAQPVVEPINEITPAQEDLEKGRISDPWLAAIEAHQIKKLAQDEAKSREKGNRATTGMDFEIASREFDIREKTEIEKEAQGLLTSNRVDNVEDAKNFVRARRAYVIQNSEYLDLKKKFRDEVNTATIETSKKAYEDARVDVAKKFYEKKISEIEERGAQPEDRARLEAGVRASVLNEFFTLENQKLQSNRVEGWPPKEHGILRKAVEKYAALPKLTRWAIGGAISTGSALLLGSSIVATGIPLYALFGIRVARGALTGTTIQGLGKVVDSFWGKKTSKQLKDHESGLAYKYKDNFVENLGKIATENKQFIEKQARQTAVKDATKIAAGIGLGVGAASMLSNAENWIGNSFGSHASAAAETQNVPTTGKASTEDLTRKAEEAAALKRAAREAQEALVKEQGRIEELATVGNHEGLWHPVLRQYEDVIAKDPTKFGLTGDATKSQIHALAEHKTTRFLSDKGYLGKDGEFWVKKAGTKIFIDENSKYGSGEVAENELSLHKLAPKPQENISPVPKTGPQELGEKEIVPDSKTANALHPHTELATEHVEELPKGFHTDAFDPYNAITADHERFLMASNEVGAVVLSGNETVSRFAEDIEKYLDIKKNISLADQERFIATIGKFKLDLDKFDEAVKKLEDGGFELEHAHRLSDTAWERIREAEVTLDDTKAEYAKFIGNLGIQENYQTFSGRTLANLSADPKIVLEHQELTNGIRGLNPTAADQSMTLDAFLKSRASLGGFEKHTPFIENTEHWAPMEKDIVVYAEVFEGFKSLHSKLSQLLLDSTQGGPFNAPLSLSYLHESFGALGYQEQEEILKKLLENGLKQDIDDYKSGLEQLASHGVKSTTGGAFIEGVENALNRLYEVHTKSAEVYETMRNNFGFTKEVFETPAYRSMTVDSVLSAANINERFKDFAEVIHGEEAKLLALNPTLEEISEFKAMRIDNLIQRMASAQVVAEYEN